MSVQFDRFNYTDCNQNCPESCTNKKFTRNVEYVKYHEPIYRTIRKFVTATGSNDIDISGFQISFPSMGVASIVISIVKIKDDLITTAKIQFKNFNHRIMSKVRFKLRHVKPFYLVSYIILYNLISGQAHAKWGRRLSCCGLLPN